MSLNPNETILLNVMSKLPEMKIEKNTEGGLLKNFFLNKCGADDKKEVKAKVNKFDLAKEKLAAKAE